MKVELIVTDVDGTAVKYDNEPFYSSWDALTGVFSEEQREKWFGIRDEYLSKDNGFYQKWFDKQVSSLKGILVSDVEKILFPLPYTKGFKEFFLGLNGMIKKAILSAGVDIVAKKINRELKFDYLVSQYLEVEDGLFTGKGRAFKSGLDKSRELMNLCENAKVSLSKVCYVGDTSKDISCFELVGFPVAFEPKYGLEKYVKEKNIFLINDFKELSEILN